MQFMAQFRDSVTFKFCFKPFKIYRLKSKSNNNRDGESSP